MTINFPNMTCSKEALEEMGGILPISSFEIYEKNGIFEVLNPEMGKSIISNELKEVIEQIIMYLENDESIHEIGAYEIL